MIAALGLLLQLSQPRWAVLRDIRLGGPVDDILAKGGECRPGDAVGPLGPGMSVYSFAQMTRCRTHISRAIASASGGR